MGDENTFENEALTEREERREAEIEFVNCAYSSDEARSTADGIILRYLTLNITTEQNIDNNVIRIELKICMPPTYPDSAALEISHATTVSSSFSLSPSISKLIINSMPELIRSCREVAQENSGEESVLSVFHCADTWTQEIWPELLQSHLEERTRTTSQSKASLSLQKHQQQSTNTIELGRRAIFSHHIINNTKRKFILNLAAQYELGGYMKIGWPGVILIEGLEQNCQQFWDEIRPYKWQFITMRHEESFDVESMQELNQKRQFGWPCQFLELGKKDMSTLAQYCRDAGLEYLFLSCLNIANQSNAENHKNDFENISNDDVLLKETNSGKKSTSRHEYGILIHVDHMNDEKRYRKWLYRSAQELSCSILINQSSSVSTEDFPERNIHNNTYLIKRPIIIVALKGDEMAIKQYMKRWRTSRVDVDSKGKPCLERKMTILCEGEIDANKINTNESSSESCYIQNGDDFLELPIFSLAQKLQEMGGYTWRKYLEEKFM